MRMRVCVPVGGYLYWPDDNSQFMQQHVANILFILYV